MKQNEINYKDVIDLDFKRIPFPDSIFFNQYGFECFLVQKKLHKNFYAEWDCETRTVEIVKHKKSNILGRLKVDTLENLKSILNFIISK